MSRRNRTIPLTPSERVRVARDPRLLAAAAARYTAAGWRSRGDCLGLDPDVFFPAPQEPVVDALAVCGGCQVRDACLAAALDASDFDGVWGATTGDERRRMRQVWPPTAPAAQLA